MPGDDGDVAAVGTDVAAWFAGVLCPEQALAISPMIIIGPMMTPNKQPRTFDRCDIESPDA